MLQLSIIIVNYKTPLLVLRCIESIKKTISIHIDYEIIVIDNNSNDNSEQIILGKYNDIIWIENKENYGFGRANNVGIKTGKGEYFLLLNSDIVVCENTIAGCLLRIVTDKSIGALGCKLVNEDGSLQKSIYYNVANSRYLLEYNLLFDYFFKIKKKSIKAIMGSFMLIPRMVIEQTGGFDPDFFMYSEEIELCSRIIKLGYKIDYYEEVSAIHKHGASSSNKLWILKQSFLSNALLVYKLRGVARYVLFLLLYMVNTITNFFLMWFIGKEYRKAFFQTEKAFYSNFYYYFVIPLKYRRKRGDGILLLR